MTNISILEQPLILLDGAIGTELDKRIDTPKLPWSLDSLIFYPHLLKQVHQSYIDAGARVITTNAFRTNQRTLARVDWSVVALPDTASDTLKAIWAEKSWGGLEQVLNHLAVDIAKRAREASGKDVLIAGNLAPLEDCFAPEKSPPFDISLPEHQQKAQYLAEAGADLLLIETMNSLPESEAALKAAVETGLPVWISFIFEGQQNLLSNESLDDLAMMLKRYADTSLSAVLLNCFSANVMDRAVPQLAQALSDTSLRIGAYANVEGLAEGGIWQRHNTLTSQHYLDHAQRWFNHGASIIGGCCGTTPEDISVLNGHFFKN